MNVSARTICKRFTTLLVILVFICDSRAEDASPKNEASDEVSYSNDIQFIVSNYCSNCHRGDEPDGGLRLDSYADLRQAAEKGDLFERINDVDDPMPPAGLMSQRLRKLMKQWADGSYVNKGSEINKKSIPVFKPANIKAINIKNHGFELLERLQGHWVGSMNLMGEDMPWFAWDYRAIAPSHVHAIFEGGSLGNLFTSFFVAKYKGKHVLMARNGGVLRGIYRTSYFLLNKINTEEETIEYQLVDAFGGKDIMWMSLIFAKDTLTFTAYTSRLGLTDAKQHMRFTGKKMHPELAAKAARNVGFPQRIPAYSFKNGLPLPDWGPHANPSSYSYIWDQKDLSITELAALAGDPISISDMPYLSQLELRLQRGNKLKNSSIGIYLSQKSLTNKKGQLIMNNGFVDEDTFNSILMFSELSAAEETFTFTYLHPGDYYLTAIADINKDGYPSMGDLSHSSIMLSVPSESKVTANIPAIDVEN